MSSLETLQLKAVTAILINYMDIFKDDLCLKQEAFSDVDAAYLAKRIVSLMDAVAVEDMRRSFEMSGNRDANN